MKVLLDTNVILDIALERQPSYLDARRVMIACGDGRLSAFITASMVTDIYYLLRKFKSKKFAIEFLGDLLRLIDVCQVDKTIILAALNSAFTDFEDAVQNAAAIESGLDCIVTRNTSDYQTSPLIVMTPEQFVSRHLA